MSVTIVGMMFKPFLLKGTDANKKQPPLNVIEELVFFHVGMA
jgi:hypothetical protein